MNYRLVYRTDRQGVTTVEFGSQPVYTTSYVLQGNDGNGWKTLELVNYLCLPPEEQTEIGEHAKKMFEEGKWMPGYPKKSTNE